MPEIGVDLAVDELELVEVTDAVGATVDSDMARFAEGGGITEAEGICAVRSYDFGGGAGHAPALAGVGKLAEKAEGAAVVDEAKV